MTEVTDLLQPRRLKFKDLAIPERTPERHFDPFGYLDQKTLSEASNHLGTFYDHFVGDDKPDANFLRSARETLSESMISLSIIAPDVLQELVKKHSIDPVAFYSEPNELFVLRRLSDPTIEVPPVRKIDLVNQFRSLEDRIIPGSLLIHRNARILLGDEELSAGLKKINYRPSEESHKTYMESLEQLKNEGNV